MSEPRTVPFHQTFLTGKEKTYIDNVLETGHTCADGPFTRACRTWLEEYTGAPGVLMTHSCTNALELAAVLADIGPDDEVIMPSFTFSSTASAFALRGATPVFVDIGPDMNIDPGAIEKALTPRTRAIVPVHYAGMACDMDKILKIAERNGLLVIEDAAQALMASHRNRPLGSIGHLGAFSFHMTKNISAGEGGALVVNDPRLLQRAEIIHDKGTNRAQFRAGQIRQYQWVDLGMSAPPSELQMACLLAQLESAREITHEHLTVWNAYQHFLFPLSEKGAFHCPQPKAWQLHNGHIYGLLLRDSGLRDHAAELLAESGIQTALHYQPLHQSPAGTRLGKARGQLPRSETLPAQLLRLPVRPLLPPDTPERVAAALRQML